MKPLHMQRHGVVMMEFLIALLPVLLAFLGTVQFSFAAIAKLTIRHSAALGARAAIVVLEEHDCLPGTREGIYKGLPAGFLEQDSENGDAVSNGNTSIIKSTVNNMRRTKTIVDKLKVLFNGLKRRDSRVNQIRNAVYLPLLSVSPNVIDEGLGYLTRNGPSQDTVGSAIRDSSVSRLLGAYIYNLGAVAITFPNSPGAKEYKRDAYQHDEDVTVRVSYLFRCRIPLVSLIMCDSGWALFSGSVWADPATYWELRQYSKQRPKSYREIPAWNRQLNSAQQRIAKRQERIDAFRDHQKDFSQVESKTIQNLLLFQPGARYMIIQAEATLPLQGAQYYPRGNEHADRSFE